MKALLCLLLAACAVADESENRRSKLPYIADAVGNTLPPPSNGPATVGSPVNLLTPDRYEFYTFDESGELVKRLMTLEEIQAIVAAGEETEGLVTFANENQPTIAFNFSQPPYTKVHNVVTNVQNVLKAQMEAHKNKPQIQPTLDTPDVSDSWSLILPSIFGNTGVDIVPDKTSSSFTTPETETIELDRPIDDNSISKEGSNQILNTSSTKVNADTKQVSTTHKISTTTEKIKVKPTTSTTTTTTTRKPTTTTTTARPFSSTTTQKPTTTTNKPTTTTTASPSTVKLRTTTTTTTSRPRTSPTTTTTTTTPKPTTKVVKTTPKPTTTTAKPTTKIIRTTPRPTSAKPYVTTHKIETTHKETETNFTKIQIQTVSNTISPSTEKSTIKYEKISAFIPVSTASYVTERSTQKPVQTTRKPIVTTTKKYASTSTTTPSTTTKHVQPSTTTKKVQPAPTTYKPSISTSAYVSSTLNDDIEKFNATTITTQSVSPSTTVSSTEFVSIGSPSPITKKKPEISTNDIKQDEPPPPLFDITQSLSQIASDLGGNYRPIPTASALLDSTKINDMNLESKENAEIDIPIENEEKPVTEKIKLNETGQVTDNFVKISTLEPHSQNENKEVTKEALSKPEVKVTTMSAIKSAVTTSAPTTTTIDPVLSESMGDLLQQIVNQERPSIVNAENKLNKDDEIFTTVAPENTTKVDEVPKTDNKTKLHVPIETKTTSKVKDNIKDFNSTENIKNTNQKIQNQKETTQQETQNINKNQQIENKETIKDKTETNEPQKIEDNKNYSVKVSENKSDTKKEETVSTSQTTSTVKPVVESENKSKNNNDIEVKKDVPDKQGTPPLLEKESEVATKRTTTTKSPQISEMTKKPVTLTKIENAQINTNKIIPTDKKENDKPKEGNSEGILAPKVDDFKKKFQKVNIDDKELANDRNNSWKLISTVSPPKANEIPKDKLKTENQENPSNEDIVLYVSKENQGLEVTTKDLSEDVAQFTELCNELAFRYWHALTQSIDKRRSFVLSPYAVTSMLAMMFMGAKGATSGEMNEILKLDDMVTFNPHFTLKNISDSIETTPDSGVIVSAFVRELFSDRSKGKILTFYKERAQHFYSGHVEEINFKLISDIIRRRTNLLVKRHTWGRIVEYMKSNSITMHPPLAAFSANIVQTDCTGTSVEGRDGEMYFVVSPNVRQRRLVPVPAVVYKSGFLAGYDPVLDATAAALGNTNSIISTLFLMPGQQGNVVHGEDLEALEKRLLDSNPTMPAWNRLLRTLLPRIGLELQIPRFSHKSLFNVSTTLKNMGLKELFDPENADLGGLNGPSKDLYLSDMVQSTTFVTCGEGGIGEQHHIEEYPETLSAPQRRRTSRWATGWDEPRDYQRAFHDPHDVGDAMNLPLHLRPRQARLPARNAQPARLKFDRPFLYFVRHNPTGMILYVGRYNPRLLP